MTEKQKRDSVKLYNPNYDKELGIKIIFCKQKCHEYNLLSPIDFENKTRLLDDILAEHGQNTTILSFGIMAFGNPCKVYRKLTEEEMK